MSKQKELETQTAPALTAADPTFALQQPIAQWWPQVRAAFGTGRAVLAPRQRIYWHKSEHERQPAVLVRFGPKRALIDLREPEPFTRGKWLSRERWVDPQTLAPRVLPHQEFGEPLQLHERGFHITAWRHPARGHTAFPGGVWYGQIDGATVGAPCTSEQGAVHQAWMALVRGGWRAHLISQVETLRRQLDSVAPDRAQELGGQLERLSQQLGKIDALDAPQAACLSPWRSCAAVPNAS